MSSFRDFLRRTIVRIAHSDTGGQQRSPNSGGINPVLCAQTRQRPTLSVQTASRRDVIRCQPNSAKLHSVLSEQSGHGQTMDAEPPS
jgi:hypothetical protein